MILPQLELAAGFRCTPYTQTVLQYGWTVMLEMMQPVPWCAPKFRRSHFISFHSTATCLQNGSTIQTPESPLCMHLPGT